MSIGNKISSIIGFDKLILSAVGCVLMAIIAIGTKEYVRNSLGIDEMQVMIESNRANVCSLLDIVSSKEKNDIRTHDAQEEINQILQIQTEKLLRNRNNRQVDSKDLFDSVSNLKKHYNCT